VPAKQGPLRFAVQDVYEIQGEKVLVGRVGSGTIRSGQKVVFQPSGKTATVDYIKLMEGRSESASVGESIGLILKDDTATATIRRGQIACDGGAKPIVTNELRVRFFWMSPKPLKLGERLDLKCATQQSPCEITAISERIDSASLEVLDSEAKELQETQVAKLSIRTDQTMCVDPFERVTETGQFVLMRDNDTVAGGVLHKER